MGDARARMTEQQRKRKRIEKCHNFAIEKAIKINCLRRRAQPALTPSRDLSARRERRLRTTTLQVWDSNPHPSPATADSSYRRFALRKAR